MCLKTISVDWQGKLYDCDFNQMLALPLKHPDSGHIEIDSLIASDNRPKHNGVLRKGHLRDLLVDGMNGQRIAVGDHCYGCTAGQGSSCGGALELT